MADPKQEETYSQEETVKRREATLKVMLATPHKKHKPIGERKSATKKRGV